MKMKKLIFLTMAIGLSGSIANAASLISCRLNMPESEKMVSKYHQEDEETQVSDLERFTLNIQEKKLVGGNLIASDSLGADEVIFGDDGMSKSAANENDVQVSFNPQKMQMHLSVDGWDHFSYKVKINSVMGKASLSGEFQYDCADRKKMYAVYDCETVE